MVFQIYRIFSIFTILVGRVINTQLSKNGVCGKTLVLTPVQSLYGRPFFQSFKISRTAHDSQEGQPTPTRRIGGLFFSITSWIQTQLEWLRQQLAAYQTA